jgi:hypothetical protein
VILIENNLNLFNKFERDIIQSKMDNFMSHEEPKISHEQPKFDEPTISNFYTRQKLSNPKEILPIFFYNLENYIKESVKLNCILENVWINKITEDTNKKDEFHTDTSDFTMIMYLNDDFIGGEFEYIDKLGDSIKIKPKKDTIVFSNNKLLHRVLPVLNGVRYSLVCFYNFEKKLKKTIL